MRIDAEKTKLYFEKEIQEKYLDFIKKRNVISTGYIQALKEGKYGMLEENVILIDGEEFMVTYILGASKESIYDLIRVNQFFDMSAEEGTAFAILLGDDYLFFKPNDEKVYFFRRDTEEVIEVAEDYDSFMNFSDSEEEENNESI